MGQIAGLVRTQTYDWILVETHLFHCFLLQWCYRLFNSSISSSGGGHSGSSTAPAA
jgi:hypothetical protein